MWIKVVWYTQNCKCYGEAGSYREYSMDALIIVSPYQLDNEIVYYIFDCHEYSSSVFTISNYSLQPKHYFQPPDMQSKINAPVRLHRLFEGLYPTLNFMVKQSSHMPTYRRGGETIAKLINRWVNNKYETKYETLRSSQWEVKTWVLPYGKSIYPYEISTACGQLSRHTNLL